MPSKHAAIATLALLLALMMTACTSSQQTASSPATGAGASSAASATPNDAASAQLGAQIFASGNGADGSPLGVSAGASGPCARCHGADAKGAVGPDIRWAVLTATASSSHAPRFKISNEAEFAKAVTSGDASGNQLRPMMPHFRLTPEQVSALVAYLKTL
jgi:mono/diheme cytochrome c family protein